MNKKSLDVTLLAATCLITLGSSKGFSAQIKNPNCKDFTEVNDKYSPEYLAVVDGYNKAGKKVSETIDVEGLMTEADQVKKECEKTGSQSLEAARKNVAVTSKPATAAKFNPERAQCRDFIALDESFRPVATFWVAGHSKGGAVKSGHIDEAFLERPIATLVEDCQTHPRASFYDRTKNWLSRKL